MKKNNPYLLALVKSYSAGEISRQAFIQAFSSWQKSNGINFDCKGYANVNGTFLTYRGVTGQIKNGVIVCGQIKAESVFNFQRKIDLALNAETQAIQKPATLIFFIKQAEKLGALWN
jgi:hypothetical protein